jgi:ubiquinone/menaquinone biosynthesis C-methylase UbiE
MLPTRYYQLAKEASSQIGKHPGLVVLKQLAEKAKNILDVGCGEGTRLNLLVGQTGNGTGIDISTYAINEAKKQYPQLNFVHAKEETLSFPSNTFDLVYSTFVFEHTSNQENFIREMIRVSKDNGVIVILCPNYGAPNRRSPVSIERPLPKLLSGYIHDIFLVKVTHTSFTKVIPQKIFKNPDDDTTCEPYLLKLLRFVNNFSGIKVVNSTSLWEIDDQANSIHQRLFKFLGQKNIFPFKYWGPQLFVVLKKV